MILPAPVRRLMLAVHLVASVGWIGAALAYLALGLAAQTGDAATVRAAWTAMDVVGWRAIVPLALGALVSGVALAAGTPWGLLRHYWVVFSLVLTAFATAVLLLHMPGVSATARLARQAGAARLETLGGDLPHAGIGLLLLIGVHVLNLYKPRGLTPYGWRKQQARRAGARPGAGTPPAVRRAGP